jgi:hypothetical protein
MICNILTPNRPARRYMYLNYLYQMKLEYLSWPEYNNFVRCGNSNDRIGKDGIWVNCIDPIRDNPRRHRERLPRNLKSSPKVSLRNFQDITFTTAFFSDNHIAHGLRKSTTSDRTQSSIGSFIFHRMIFPVFG